jgi:hypothetical protein
VPGLRYQELASKDAGEASAVIRQRVNQARKIQLQRFDNSKIHANAQMGSREIKRYCVVKPDADKLLETAINKLGLSARLQPRVESRQNHRGSRRKRRHRSRTHRRSDPVSELGSANVKPLAPKWVRLSCPGFYGQLIRQQFFRLRLIFHRRLVIQ